MRYKLKNCKLGITAETIEDMIGDVREGQGADDGRGVREAAKDPATCLATKNSKVRQPGTDLTFCVIDINFAGAMSRVSPKASLLYVRNVEDHHGRGTHTRTMTDKEGAGYGSKATIPGRVWTCVDTLHRNTRGLCICITQEW